MDINRRKIAQVAIDRLRFKLLWRSKSLKKSCCRLKSLESAERDEDHRCSTSTSLILIKRNLRWKSSALPIVRSASNRCGWKSFPESFRWNSRPTISRHESTGHPSWNSLSVCQFSREFACNCRKVSYVWFTSENGRWRNFTKFLLSQCELLLIVERAESYSDAPRIKSEIDNSQVGIFLCQTNRSEELWHCTNTTRTT